MNSLSTRTQAKAAYGLEAVSRTRVMAVLAFILSFALLSAVAGTQASVNASSDEPIVTLAR
jgi:hypothetical protein